MKEIKLTNSAEKDLKKLNESLAKNILVRLKEYSIDPKKGDVQLLERKKWIISNPCL